jgi:hypothetical protein
MSTALTGLASGSLVSPSMLELPFARQHHGDAMLVGGRDDLVVAE